MAAFPSMPYYGLHYALNAAVLDPRSDAGREWRGRQVLDAGPAHTVARMGMASEADDAALAALLRVRAPLLKLSWKHDLEREDGTPTVVAAALAREERRLLGAT